MFKHFSSFVKTHKNTEFSEHQLLAHLPGKNQPIVQSICGGGNCGSISLEAALHLSPALQPLPIKIGVGRRIFEEKQKQTTKLDWIWYLMYFNILYTSRICVTSMFNCSACVGAPRCRAWAPCLEFFCCSSWRMKKCNFWRLKICTSKKFGSYINLSLKCGQLATFREEMSDKSGWNTWTKGTFGVPLPISRHLPPFSKIHCIYLHIVVAKMMLCMEISSQKVWEHIPYCYPSIWMSWLSYLPTWSLWGPRSR